MLNRRKLFHLYLVFALLASLPLSGKQASPADGEAVLAEARAFLQALRSRNMAAAMERCETGLQVRYYTKDEIKGVIDRLILNQISTLSYLRTLTGFNIHKFFYTVDGNDWRVTQVAIQPSVYMDRLKDGQVEFDYFFLRAEVTVNESTKETGATREIKLECELGLSKRDGRLKVLGMIF